MADEPPSSGAGHGPAGRSRDTLEWDYERTLELFLHLSDIRFKLAGFIPVLTGAAVALLTTGARVSNVQQGVLSSGGLLFVLGIAIYDLRNSGFYNAMAGRLCALEHELGLLSFDPEGSTAKAEQFGGPMRSRDASRKRNFYGLKVSHSTGTTLAYSTAFGAWVWALADAAAADDAVPIVFAAAAALLFGLRYYTIDP